MYQNLEKNFEKANLNAIFGAVKLDLREAKLEKENSDWGMGNIRWY